MVAKSQKNACRALHRLVEYAGVTLPLQITTVSIVVKRVKPLGTQRVWWPMLTMQEWATYLLQDYPKILLGGHCLDDVTAWEGMFATFWSNYKVVDGSHPVFRSDRPLQHCIPYAFHGDEGRGRGHVPFLVISFQPLISHLGLGDCNDST